MKIKCDFCGKTADMEERRGGYDKDVFYFRPMGWKGQFNDEGGHDDICPECLKEEKERQASHEHAQG